MTETFIPIKNALISVSDKTDLAPLCRQLNQWGTRLYSTGGTAQFIDSLGIAVTPVEELTQTPEMLGGRVKTLNPLIFGGILARRNNPEDQEQIRAFKLTLFDLVIVNLYPFRDYLGKTHEEQTPFIDIGGPALIRAAAKNHQWVTVLSDPKDYPDFLSQSILKRGVDLAFRKEMAKKSFHRVSQYDLSIFNEWEKSVFPNEVVLSPQAPLRYGENPHQKAAWCGTPKWKLLQGKELSYNNLLDAEAASQLTADFSEAILAIIKHGNPCGVAWGTDNLQELFKRAFEADSKSAFGGILSTNRPIDKAAAEAISEVFIEVVISPGFDAEAISLLLKKKNLRLIEWPKPFFQPYEVRSAVGGWLIQERDVLGADPPFKLIGSSSSLFLTESDLREMRAAWRICKQVRSNAIVIVNNQRTVGIGAGQVSRIDSLEIALQKAKDQCQGAILASDAFFPFRDSIDRLKGLKLKAVIQPGGSQRDQEVIDACAELEIPLYFTGERHFKH